MKRTVVALSVVLGGCIAHPTFNIKTSAPAYVELDGVIVCEKTPCTITPPHYVGPFGECAEGSSMSLVLAAFPIDKTKGFVQQKHVKSYCGDNKTVFFDMEARGGVQTISTESKEDR